MKYKVKKLLITEKPFSETKKAPEGACNKVLKRLIERRIHMPQIVWRDLVDVIIEPVGEQQIAMAAPCRARFILRIVTREVVIRHFRRQTGVHIPEVFASQRIGIIFRVARHKRDAFVFTAEQVCIAAF